MSDDQERRQIRWEWLRYPTQTPSTIAKEMRIRRALVDEVRKEMRDLLSSFKTKKNAGLSERAAAARAHVGALRAEIEAIQAEISGLDGKRRQAQERLRWLRGAFGGPFDLSDARSMEQYARWNSVRTLSLTPQEMVEERELCRQAEEAQEVAAGLHDGLDELDVALGLAKQHQGAIRQELDREEFERLADEAESAKALALPALEAARGPMRTWWAAHEAAQAAGARLIDGGHVAGGTSIFGAWGLVERGLAAGR